MGGDSYAIFISSRAVQDIEEFLDYAEHAEAARKFADYLLTDRLRLLCQFPMIFPEAAGYKSIRKITEPPFLIFYRIDETAKTIQVLRYWHGAKDGKPFLG